jgi:hypothetical protein
VERVEAMEEKVAHGLADAEEGVKGAVEEEAGTMWDRYEVGRELTCTVVVASSFFFFFFLG